MVLTFLAAARLLAQTGGVIVGHVRDGEGAPIEGAQVVVVGGQRTAATDSAGAYRIRDVRSGWKRVLARSIGFQVVYRDSVRVEAGQVTVVDFVLARAPVELAPMHITAPVDVVLDPLAVATTQRINADDLRHLPVTTLEEAVALSAGAVGESYRGGRLGQTAFIIDGLGVKNQLDASTGGLGLRIPPDILTEAALVTNGFSARYGQALSGLINVVTKDGGDRWAGRFAYENDRPFPDAWDLGLDRVVLEGDGPLVGRIRFLGAVDASGRLDADPVNAPAPTDPLDPRRERPNLLPHNSGEQVDAAAKLMIPLGTHHTVRLFGLHSIEQRLLFDAAYKYDQGFAPARRITGDLVSGHWQYASGSRAGRSFISDFRLAYFAREFIRGTPVSQPDYRLGAFTGRALHFVGEDLARAQDTARAAAAIPGFEAPFLSENTPYGVPAFFLGGGSRGELSWNRFGELRTQLDLNYGAGRDVDFYVGGEVVRQSVRTFQRALGYRPVGGDVPPATAARFSPVTGAAYTEAQFRAQDIAFTVGLRYDQFDSRKSLGDTTGARARPRQKLGPRFGISTVLRGATVVVSWGRFAQAPDYQYLVDAAFDDTTRTGRFRAGNPNLGFESSSQYEFSLRMRPTPVTSLHINAYVKHLEGLVASVPFGLNADSSIFGNTDFGTVQGVEILWERELVGGWGARVSYTLQTAQATATNPFQLFSRIRIAPGGNGDTILPARLEIPLDYDRRHGLTAILQGRVSDSSAARFPGDFLVRGLEAAVIVRSSSGLPYSRTNAAGDTLIGLPNSWRLPWTATVDALVRRPIRLRGLAGSVYVDARNLLGRRNIVAVRRDTGTPGIGDQGVSDAADVAYAAHSEDIPYESPRYRARADLDGNGLISGPDELMPLFRSAARDYYQPIFNFGPPRVVRIGVEVIF
jgi:hypothetical protein